MIKFFTAFSAPILVAILLFPLAAISAPYQIDYDQSRVEFSAIHADTPFKGVFKEWSATINFDADNLSSSSLKAEFVLKSASTGNTMYDGTLPQKDWFNVSEHPTATFISDNITHKEGDIYHVTGKLTLRGITQDVGFDFTLSDTSKNPVKAQARFPLDRLAFDIGKKSDDKAEWVSQEITLTLDIVAEKN